MLYICRYIHVICPNLTHMIIFANIMVIFYIMCRYNTTKILEFMVKLEIGLVTISHSNCV